jgi:rhodanese-related sulfurtransferase
MKGLETIARAQADNGGNLTDTLGCAQGRRGSLAIGIVSLCAVVVIVFLFSRFSLQREVDAGLQSSSSVLTPIPAEELKNWLDEGHSFRLVDARSPEEFAAGHIPTAITVHRRSQNKSYRENAQDIPVVVYCDGLTTSKASPCFQAIGREFQSGARHVYWFQGGMAVWQAQGYPLTQTDG